MMLQEAQAVIKGSPQCPHIRGLVRFTDKDCGCVVQVRVENLPCDRGCPPRFHGFYIHDCGDCRPARGADPFPGTGGVFNPARQCPGRRAGDLTPLLASDGAAIATFYTGAFRARDIVGKSVVIDMEPDDFCGAPRGCGQKIACGEICPIAPCDPCGSKCKPTKPLWPKPPRSRWER